MFNFGIIPFELAKNWTEKLFTELRKIKSLRNDEINEIANIFGDPEELAEYYIEPDCQQFNPADSDNEDAYHLVREPVFERIETFFSGDSARSGRQLFVLSDAGMGKTSLLVMLKLAHLTSFWPKSYDCVLLKLGQSTILEISKIKNKRDTILLLDALDEDPLAWNNREGRTKEILKETENFRRVVITCRTQFLVGARDPFNRRGRIEAQGFLCPVIFNSLFSDRQIVRYLTKRFPIEVQLPDWQDRVSKIISSMGFLKMRPMLLAHIEDLIQSDETEWNEYNIYRALIAVWLLREQKKILQTQPTSPSVVELLNACRFMALTIHRKDRPYLTMEEMATRSSAYSGVSKIPAMQLGVRSLLNRDSEGNYKFSHYSILEFLVVDSIIEGAFPQLTESIRSTSLMTVFAASWIRSGNHKSEIIRKLRDISLNQANLSECDLSGINLSTFDCLGANFANSNLSGSVFDGAHLKGANFYNAKLAGSSFRMADLSGATLVFSDANKSTFRDANLTNADFTSANIRGASLATPQSSGINLDHTQQDESTIQPLNLKSQVLAKHAQDASQPSSPTDLLGDEG